MRSSRLGALRRGLYCWTFFALCISFCILAFRVPPSERRLRHLCIVTLGPAPHSVLRRIGSAFFFSLESGPDLCIGLIVVLIQHHRHATRRFISVHWSCRFLDLKAQHQLPLLPFRTELPHCISTLSDPLTISYHHNSTHLLSFQDAQPNGHSSTPYYRSSDPFAQHPTYTITLASVGIVMLPVDRASCLRRPYSTHTTWDTLPPKSVRCPSRESE